MPTDEALSRRILDAAAELFANHGYEGTRIRMVAERAGVTSHTVRRLTGERAELFAAVMANKVESAAAALVSAAAYGPEPGPALSALVEAAAEVYVAPARSWDTLELEAVTRAQRDDGLKAIEARRVQQRWDAIRSVVERARAAGNVDQNIDTDALAHFALAISVGLAMVDPLLETRPRVEDWNALIARIGTAMAPVDLLLEREHEAMTPWRLRVDVPDRPGGLARLVRALDAMHIYAAGVQVVGLSLGFRTIDLAILAPEHVPAAAILAAATSTGRNGYITAGSLDDAMDLPTRMLDVAGLVVEHPGWAPQAAAQLVAADRMEVIDATEGADDRADLLRLQWTPDRHVLLHRDWAPFARAEQTRASALLRLSSAIAAHTGEGDARGWVETIKGGTAWIRLAHPEDADAVAAMHERCSDRTRYLRYVSLGEWRDLQLRRLSGGHRGATLVAMSEEGAIVGLANVFPDRESEGRAAELAVIIEDAYQGRGLGTAMLRRMIELATRLGFHEVVAVVLAENTGMIGLLERTGLAWSVTVSGGMGTWRAPLPVV